MVLSTIPVPVTVIKTTAPINQRYPLEYPVCGKVLVVLVVTVVLASAAEAVVPGTGVTEVSGSVTGIEIVVPV